MRIISKKETICFCNRCKSEIGILAHEFHFVYDDDRDSSNEGKTYWTCPVCTNTNWYGSNDDYIDI
jgi:hypothetical protein